MIFFFLIRPYRDAGNFFLPMMIGARDCLPAHHLLSWYYW